MPLKVFFDVTAYLGYFAERQSLLVFPRPDDVAFCVYHYGASPFQIVDDDVYLEWS